MRVKATEIRLLAEILEQQHESAEDAARACIEALELKREDDERFYVVSVDGLARSLGITWVVGPYPTRLQAAKALEKYRAPEPGARAVVGHKAGLCDAGYRASTPYSSPLEDVQEAS